LVRSNPSTFTRDWALRWVRGSVESYLLGRTSLEVVRGRVRRAVESYGVSPEEVSTKVQTALFMLANAMMVHEALATSGAVKGLQPLSGIDRRNPIEWLKQEWDKVLATDYEPIFRFALEFIKR
jgi:hypothetical protein